MSYKYLFGPVPSRRLGVSLGIDLFPGKICNFNCIYCECGKTVEHTNYTKDYADNQKVLSEVQEYVNENKYLDYITFAGRGEPLLQKNIDEIINGIKSMTDVPVAIITNGSMFCEPGVIDEVKNADLIMPSLDSVTEDVFAKINNPVPGISIKKIIGGLVDLRNNFAGKIFLEIFVIDGVNNTKEEIAKFREAIKKINPDKIQINSLDRPPAFKDVQPVSIDRLKEFKDEIGFENAEIVKKFERRENIINYTSNIEEMILNLLKKRAVNLEDLLSITGIDLIELNNYLDILEREKKVKSIVGNNGVQIKFVEEYQEGK